MSFVRFKTDQLAKLKKCQLQVFAVNKGKWDVLSPHMAGNRAAQKAAKIRSSTFTWRGGNFMQLSAQKPTQWKYSIDLASRFTMPSGEHPGPAPTLLLLPPPPPAATAAAA